MCCLVLPVQAQRTTIIIRDLPAGTTEEELWALFETNGLVKPHSISSVVNNWFVTMADEDNTASTFTKLRSLTFKGETVKARVKSEHVLRGGGPSGATGECRRASTFGFCDGRTKKRPEMNVPVPPCLDVAREARSSR